MHLADKTDAHHTHTAWVLAILVAFVVLAVLAGIIAMAIKICKKEIEKRERNYTVEA